jgi:ATP-dependent RNA helicase DDX60
MSFVPAPQQANAASHSNNAAAAAPLSNNAPSASALAAAGASATAGGAAAAAAAAAAEPLSDQELIFKMRTFDVYWVEKHALMYKDGYAKVRMPRMNCLRRLMPSVRLDFVFSLFSPTDLSYNCI